MHDLSEVKPFLDKPFPYTALQEKCLKDLETTQEGQAHHVLERPNRGFCCLGRFCVAAKAERKQHDRTDVYFIYKGQTAYYTLPSPLAEELQMEAGGKFRQPVSIKGQTYCSLVAMNDSGWFTFKEIAQYIRHDPWNVLNWQIMPKGNENE